jgi:uncharacterized protein YabN with tetrapyrrole methylase and pyrophosphatase domain
MRHEIVPFHHAMVLRNGEQHQLDKVVEEMGELDHAVRGRNRDEVVEEYSDVINILPYIEIIFNIKIKPFLLPKHHVPFKNKFLRRMIVYIMQNHGGQYSLFRETLKELLKIYLLYLEDIRKEFEITDEEVTAWLEEKKRRYR